jgi:hypothetical protein
MTLAWTDLRDTFTGAQLTVRRVTAVALEPFPPDAVAGGDNTPARAAFATATGAAALGRDAWRSKQERNENHRERFHRLTRCARSPRVLAAQTSPPCACCRIVGIAGDFRVMTKEKLGRACKLVSQAQARSDRCIRDLISSLGRPRA